MQWPPRPGPGIKRHEAERLGGGAVDDFPDIEVHAQGELLQFVDQRDVHAAENIFKQLDHLRRARRADRHDFRDDLRVEVHGRLALGGIDAADHFRNLRQAELLVAGIFALGRKRQVKIGRACFRRFGAARPADTSSRPFRGSGSTSSSVVPGIGGAFEHDELVFLQIRRDGLRGLFHVAQVGLAAFIERSRDADQNCVHFAELREIRGGVEMFASWTCCLILAAGICWM